MFVALMLLLSAQDTEIRATAEILEASRKSYLDRANACRRDVVTRIEQRMRGTTDSLASARRGQIDLSLVGKEASAGTFDFGRWRFGTPDDKSAKIRSLEMEAASLRSYLSRLRARQIHPQLALEWKGATLGATGTLPDDYPIVTIIGDSSLRISVLRNWAVAIDGGGRQVVKEWPERNLIVTVRGIDAKPFTDKPSARLPGVWTIAAAIRSTPQDPAEFVIEPVPDIPTGDRIETVLNR